MKRVSFFFVLVGMLSSFYVKSEPQPCFGGEFKACEIIMKSDGDNKYLFSSLNVNSQNPIFQEPEEDSIMESSSFFRDGKNYLLVRESFDISKSKEIVSFSSDLKSVSYLTLSSEVDLDTNDRYWSGFYCTNEHAEKPEGNISAIGWAFMQSCKVRPQYITSKSYSIKGNDMIIDIPVISGGIKKGIMKLVAINALSSDNLNISDFGCMDNCPDVRSDADFTGRVSNASVQMYLNIVDDKVSGYYYYVKYGKRIALTGTSEDGNIKLQVKDKGVIVEEFIGTLQDGKFYGDWMDLIRHKKHPFSLYFIVR